MTNLFSDKRIPVTLNGVWQFCMDPNGTKADDIIAGNTSVAWRQVNVPCDIAHACPEQPDYIGPCWFKRDIEIPSEMTGKRVVLHFEAVNYIAAVFLNGRFVGRNIHGFLPFEFDITEYVEFDFHNVLLVMTDHRRDYGELPTYFGWKNAGGIIRDVCLYATDIAYIARIRLHSALNGEAGVFTALGGYVPPDARISVNLTCTATGETKTACTYAAQAEQTINLRVDNPKLWSPEEPNLYVCTVTLSGENVEDVVETTYGYRKLEVCDGQFYLNGSPYFLKGFNYHEDNIKTGGAVCREIAETDIRTMKGSGANFLRCHYPHDRNVLNLADELGIIFMAEIPLNALFLPGFSVPAGANKNEARLNQVFHNAKEMLSRLFERDWNHPSVCFWSVSNEGNELEEIVNEINNSLLQYVKATDPDRLCVHASMGGYFNKDNIDRLYKYDDAICINVYTTLYRRMGLRNFNRDLTDAQISIKDTIDWLKSCYPGKPIIFTEFGYGTDRSFDGIISEDIQCDCIAAEYPVIREHAQGVMLWVYADHPWPPRIVSEGYDLSTYGLFRRDRTPKKAYEVYKKLLLED